ncbi:MAG: hypothetical protein U0169_26740 [Polyangiaceae bacterium]
MKRGGGFGRIGAVAWGTWAGALALAAVAGGTGCAYGSGPDGDDLAIDEGASRKDAGATTPNQTPIGPAGSGGKRDAGADARVDGSGSSTGADASADPGMDDPDKFPKTDGGKDAGAIVDASRDVDAPDAGILVDADVTDATTPVDAHVPDVSVPDATADVGTGAPDAGVVDPPEASVPDVSVPVSDAGPATGDFCPLTIPYYNKLIAEMANNPDWRDCSAQALCQTTHCCYAAQGSSGICVER